MMVSPNLLSVAEVSERTGLTKKQVKWLARRNLIPAVRLSLLGNHIKFHPEVLDAWIKEGRLKTAAWTPWHAVCEDHYGRGTGGLK
jgi:excisionase family DNA binding protein